MARGRRAGRRAGGTSWTGPVTGKDRKGECLLCPGYDRLVCYSAFRQHMQRYHLPSESCSKCGETFRPGVREESNGKGGMGIRYHDPEGIAAASLPGLGDSYRISSTRTVRGINRRLRWSCRRS